MLSMFSGFMTISHLPVNGNHSSHGCICTARSSPATGNQAHTFMHAGSGSDKCRGYGNSAAGRSNVAPGQQVRQDGAKRTRTRSQARGSHPAPPPTSPPAPAKRSPKANAAQAPTAVPVAAAAQVAAAAKAGGSGEGSGSTGATDGCATRRPRRRLRCGVNETCEEGPAVRGVLRRIVGLFVGRLPMHALRAACDLLLWQSSRILRGFLDTTALMEGCPMAQVRPRRCGHPGTRPHPARSCDWCRQFHWLLFARPAPRAGHVTGVVPDHLWTRQGAFHTGYHGTGYRVHHGHKREGHSSRGGGMLCGASSD